MGHASLAHRGVDRRGVRGYLCFDMKRLFNITPNLKGFVASLLLISLLLGQPGLGMSLLEWMGAGEACCGEDCPCEGSSEARDDASDASIEFASGDRHASDEDSCPDGKRCPPGCDDCVCCPGALTAPVAFGSVSFLTTALESLAMFSPTDEPATGVHGCIYRPPQFSLS